MASGDPIFTLWPNMAIPADSNFPTPSFIALTGTGAAARELVLLFDGATDETCVIPYWVSTQYAGGGIDLVYEYSMDGSDADLIELEFSFMTADDTEVFATKNFQTATGIQDTPAATAAQNKVNITAATSISDALFDAPTAGQKGWCRITRDVSAATNTDDLQFHIAYAKEQ
jgi:hypothetical protein